VLYLSCHDGVDWQMGMGMGMTVTVRGETKWKFAPKREIRIASVVRPPLLSCSACLPIALPSRI
jgi:hypothetical protein